MPMTREERDALVVRYRDGAAAFRAALADVADAELDERPIEGEWTVREIAHHLADSELTSAIRLRRLIAEDDPVIQGYDEVTFVRRLHVTDRPIASSIDAAAAARASTLTILEALPEDEWSRTGTHTDQGPYSVEDWLRSYADHPWDHAEQARRVLAALRTG
jgi:DinB family protein